MSVKHPVSGGDIKLNFKEEYAPKISYTRGQDAKFSVEINGEAMEMTRGSNTFSLDGLNVTLKDTFNTAEGLHKAVGGRIARAGAAGKEISHRVGIAVQHIAQLARYDGHGRLSLPMTERSGASHG